jgi:hypothetical protein
MIRFKNFISSFSEENHKRAFMRYQQGFDDEPKPKSLPENLM